MIKNLLLLPESGSSCVTPNGASAICRSIYQCTTLLQVINTTDSTQLRFLRESQCGYTREPLVCCGSLNNYRNVRPTSKPTAKPTQPSTTTQLKNPNIPNRTACGFQVSSFFKFLIFGGDNGV